MGIGAFFARSIADAMRAQSVNIALGTSSFTRATLSGTPSTKTIGSDAVDLRSRIATPRWRPCESRRVVPHAPVGRAAFAVHALVLVAF